MSGHTIVVYEVCLSLRRLVVKHSAQLHLLDWDIVYNIIDAVQQHLAQLQQVCVLKLPWHLDQSESFILTNQSALFSPFS